MIDSARFAKIHQHILDEHGFNMSSWEAGTHPHSVCGTTRCVAGWAIYDEINGPLYGDRGLSPEVNTLARRLGVHADFSVIAAELLGLPNDLINIFYADERFAAEFVKRAAEGATVAELREWVDDRLDF